MSRRLDRVNELLRREIGTVIQKDYEWTNRLVTVSEVEVTQDLKEGKVWIGVLGGEANSVIVKLNKEHGSIQQTGTRASTNGSMMANRPSAGVSGVTSESISWNDFNGD